MHWRDKSLQRSAEGFVWGSQGWKRRRATAVGRVRPGRAGTCEPQRTYGCPAGLSMFPLFSHLFSCGLCCPHAGEWPPLSPSSLETQHTQGSNRGGVNPVRGSTLTVRPSLGSHGAVTIQRFRCRKQPRERKGVSEMRVNPFVSVRDSKREVQLFTGRGRSCVSTPGSHTLIRKKRIPAGY